jgi:serine/threonine protein kinase
MFRKYFKDIYNYDQGVLSRIDLMKQLSQVSPIFPKLQFAIQEKTIRQYSEPIKSLKWPEEKNSIEKLWHDFTQEIVRMHNYGYVHGDILKKNIVFDGCRLRLIDHELSLVIGTELRVTFPWVAPEDLIQKQISQKTDLICLKAMRLRLFEYEKYREFRVLQTELITNTLTSTDPSINKRNHQ